MEYLTKLLLLCLANCVFPQEPSNWTTMQDDSSSTVLSSAAINDSLNTNIDIEGDVILTVDPAIIEQTTETTVDLISTTDGNYTTIIPESSPCTPNPCKNNGTCSRHPTNPFLFRCQCAAGFTGLRCAVLDLCGTCENGACVYTDDGVSRGCSCYLGMFWDEEAQKCREPEPPCFPTPCKNGGACEELEKGYRCHCKDGFDGETCHIAVQCRDDEECGNGICHLNESAKLRHCKCNKHFYLDEDKKTCQAIARPCRPNPCKNLGVCEALSSGEFNCSCPLEYSEKTCEARDWCKENDDCGKGVCTLDAGERKCRCHEGFYWDESTCREKVRPCLPNPCHNDAICVPEGDIDFTCSCPREYFGELCSQRNYCVMDGGHTYCGNAPCVNDAAVRTYYCTCEEGHYFDYADRTCKRLDLCPIIKCRDNEICRDSNCTCRSNYTRNETTGFCESNFCASSPCPAEGMACKESENSKGYSCSCPDGHAFNGTHCTSAFCAFPKWNLCGQMCAAYDHGYECGCESTSFDLEADNHTCVYNGNTICSNKTCEKGACVEKDGVEICLCPPGYSEINGECKDDCSSGRLSSAFCPGACDQAKEGVFRCKCEGKFTLSEDGVTCVARKMCAEGEKGWSTCSGRRARCVEEESTLEGFRCECGEGQAQNQHALCTRLCDIEENQKSCSVMGAQCEVNALGHRICKCPPFFQTNQEGSTCDQPAKHSYLVTLPLDLATYGDGLSTGSTNLKHHRIWLDMTNSMGSLFPGFIQASLLICRMESAWMLCKFELQFQEVSELELSRLKVPELCFGREVSPSCTLSRSLVLNKNRIVTDVLVSRTDPCDMDMKEELCGSETKCTSGERSFNCTCKTGFVFRSKVYPFQDADSFVEICKDVDECESTDACPENNDCTNTIGSFYCTCRQGYRKSTDPNDGACVEICNPSPCDHGQCSVLGDHGYECSCDEGFMGRMCNLQDLNLKRARTTTIIVGAVLGGVLLLTLVLAVVIISRLRKKKEMGDPNRIFYNTAEMTERRRPVDIGSINNAFQQE